MTLKSKLAGPNKILLSIAALLGICLAMIFMIEDIATSYKGYAEFPTHKVFTITLFAGSLAPSIAQILFGYQAYADQTGKRYLYAFLSLLFVVIDVYFDVDYKTVAERGPLYAIGESILFFAICSEGMLTIAFGVFFNNVGDARVELRKIQAAWSAGAPEPAHQSVSTSGNSVPGLIRDPNFSRSLGSRSRGPAPKGRRKPGRATPAMGNVPGDQIANLRAESLFVGEEDDG